MTEAWPQRPAPEAASLQRLLAALAAARDGDFTVRLPGSADPLLDDISATYNSLAARLSERAAARERFLPALSHELRTPLNSMLVLARLLSVNPSGNLTSEQVEYARVIHSAGTDLLDVISGLLDTDGHPSARDEPARLDAGQRLLVVEAARGGMLTLLAHGAVSGLAECDGPVEVVTVATAAEVADALEAGTPHCVVLDPAAGDELTAAALEPLRARPGSRRVPVLAHARDELAARRCAGLRAELLGSPSELRERIAWHLSAAGREAARAESRDAEAVAAGAATVGAAGAAAVGAAGSGAAGSAASGVSNGAAANIAAAGNGALGRGPSGHRSSGPRSSEQRPSGQRPLGHGASGHAASGHGASGPRPARNGAARGGHTALRGKKILVVDDDSRNVFAITSTLEHYGMTVLQSSDGRAGIDQLISEPDTDLVLMDLMMPGMDGYAAISEIREMPEFSDLPIIVVTAHTMTGDLATRVPGADDCLTKPLDTDELLGRMASCLAS